MRLIVPTPERSNYARRYNIFNIKQKELSRLLFDRLKEKFPEIKLISITPSCENPDDIWVNIIYPEDENREFELRELAAEISTDILLDYGYSISITSGEGMEQMKATV